ncbi:hypothetical protein [Rhodobacter sp. NSM]|uniref:hypothetical protein n=1 Tax=Rhodobacter sp. NSM TaxID=3457501 RepID=UPI003FD65545
MLQEDPAKQPRILSLGPNFLASLSRHRTNPPRPPRPRRNGWARYDDWSVYMDPSSALEAAARDRVSLSRRFLRPDPASIFRQGRRWMAAAAFCAMAVPVAAECPTTPEGAANRLFVETAGYWDTYQNLQQGGEWTMDEQHRLLSQILNNLDRIVSDYPESTLAVELASTGSARNLDRRSMKAVLQYLDQKRPDAGSLAQIRDRIAADARGRVATLSGGNPSATEAQQLVQAAATLAATGNVDEAMNVFDSTSRYREAPVSALVSARMSFWADLGDYPSAFRELQDLKGSERSQALLDFINEESQAARLGALIGALKAADTDPALAREILTDENFIWFAHDDGYFDELRPLMDPSHPFLVAERRLASGERRAEGRLTEMNTLSEFDYMLARVLAREGDVSEAIRIAESSSGQAFFLLSDMALIQARAGDESGTLQTFIRARNKAGSHSEEAYLLRNMVLAGLKGAALVYAEDLRSRLAKERAAVYSLLNLAHALQAAPLDP